MRFSVLLPVYSKENPTYFNSALLSIWDQQTLKPNQIVLVKDGPLTSELDANIKRWQVKLGEVLTIVELSSNMGLANALNEGLKYCLYDLVARMDSDDIALPQRFQKQVAFMRSNVDIVASSGVIEEFNDEGDAVRFRVLPQTHQDLVQFAKFRNPLSHPATIFRRHAVLSVNGYPDFSNSQDYALWSLMIVKGFKLGNIMSVILRMRAGSKMMSRRGFKYFLNEVKVVKFQRSIGFISTYELFFSIISRFIIRLLPSSLKKLFYRALR